MKTSILSVLIAFSLLCFGLSPAAKALLPPPAPDGGYPGGNTAEGINALHDVNTAVGINNTAVGLNALTNDTTGQYNVAVGSGALQNNTTGDFNMAIGTEALQQNNANFNLAIGFRVLFMNTTGNHLTGIGAAALRNNTTAGFNTAIGADALRENTTGPNNTAIGADALAQNTIAEENTAIGAFALSSNTEGDFNTATGAFALQVNTMGERNTATGNSAMFSNTTGSGNTANGNAALGFNTTGNDNTAIGSGALFFNDADNNTAVGATALLNNIASENTAVGSRALSNNTTGGSNTAMGSLALLANTMGFSNTAIGVSALGNTSGFGSTALGVGAGGALTTANNVICIGSNVFGVNVDNSCFIGNIWNQPGGSQAVYVNADGKLGALVSSRRFKKEIKPMDEGSEALFSLKPVAFRYKKEIDPAGTSQLGLVAEDVEKVNPDLVVRDKEGKPYSVRYDQVNAMLLNEFLKEHRKAEKQETTISQLISTVAQQQKDFQAAIAQLTKRLDEQASQIQKVSAHLEVNRRTPQVVSNNQ